jgi:hypothetical protein
MGPRTGLDDVENRKFLTLPGLELRTPYCPACSQSLFRLSYPGSSDECVEIKILNVHSLSSQVLKYEIFRVEKALLNKLRMKETKLEKL